MPRSFRRGLFLGLGGNSVAILKGQSVSGGAMLANAIRVEQAVLLVRTLPVFFAANILLSLFIAVELRNLFSVGEVLGWLGAVFFANAPALQHWLKFRARPRPASIGPNWNKRAILYAAIVALPWATVLLATPISLHATPYETMVLTVVIAGLTAGCLAVLTPIPEICITYVGVILLPLIGRYSAVGDEMHVVIAANMLLYVVCVFYYGKGSYRQFVDGVRARVDNERLVGELRETQSLLAKATAAKLAESESRFRDIAESASDWFWEQDKRSKLTYVSPRFSEFTGWNAETAIGKRYDELPKGVSDTEVLALFRADVLAHRPFRDIRAWRRGDDGKLRCHSISGKPIFSDTGEFLGYRGSGRDVTAEAEAADALLAAKIQAEAANRAKSQFLANMSHELRTPLNAIIGFSEMMQLQVFGPIGHARYEEYTADIHRAGSHLLAVINDILDLSKIEAGHLELKDEVVDLSDVTSSALHIIDTQARGAGVELNFDAAQTLPALRGERRAILQILLNLLSNAIKFTPAGGRVSVRCAQAADGTLALSVADTGIGVAPENIARVLEPFGQVADAYSRNHTGAGLGLPIAKSLVEAHGGALTLESVVGQGTTVTARFPADRVMGDAAMMAARV